MLRRSLRPLNTKGHISQVIGAVVDVYFQDKVPPVLTALKVDHDKLDVTLEIVQHLDRNTARCIAMETTDNLRLKTPVTNSGKQIEVPVGEGTLGRIFNVLGKAIDQRGPVQNVKQRPIHADAPTLAQQSGTDQVLDTGIKVIDLILPYCK
jgi:F-type H+-transporting ATPase subunit beta